MGAYSQQRPDADIIVVEDDAELRALMVGDLRGRGFRCHGVPSAELLYRHLSVHPCDLVVLDVGLPGEDGFSVARHLRQVSTVGILMLTGRGASADMARGLMTGADMYLVKPLDDGVLAAAVASLLRRLTQASRPAAGSTYGGTWALVQGGWSLRTPGGSELSLGSAERALLQLLVARRGRPVEREALIAAITPDPDGFDPHRLEVMVHRLRARAKTMAGQAIPLRAVRGVGYVWCDGEDR